ncbi:MAG: hypothetical protein CR967_05935 [Proteobacteria bacterium]|nr:MAG: hypothetical protein CR967_05935 [Pseudomonadota bacterium]
MEGTLTTLSTYGYIALFLYTLGGGMVAIVAAGVLSYMGKMDIYLSISIAFIANAIGDTLLFYLSRYNKEMIMPYVKKHRRKLALSHVLMKKYGDKIIFFQKFVYGIKTLIPLAIGFTKYSFIKFSILNFISSLIWAILLGYGSYMFGEAFQKSIGYISSNPWLMPLIMFPLLFGIWFYFEKYSKKK